MSVTTISSRQFNQDAGGAKRAAAKGPVFITDRGRPAHVLLSIEAYEALRRPSLSLLDAIADPESSHIDFEPPRVSDRFLRPAEFD